MPTYFHRTGRLPKTAHKGIQYKVELYCNRKKVKTLYKSRVIFPARKKYNDYLENNIIYFPKEWDWLGQETHYELLLVGNWGEALTQYKTPSGVIYNIGKTKEGFIIKDIRPYFIEEKFKHYNAQKMITFKDLLAFLMKEKYSKSILFFHNKLLIEIMESDELHLFILKNKQDAERLYKLVKKFYYENKMTDCFFFNIPQSWAGKKELYDRIHEKLGMSKAMITRQSTRV